jgi:hypothetical protein
MHLTKGPLDLILERITGWTLTVPGGARPTKASNVALPPLSKDDLDWSTNTSHSSLVGDEVCVCDETPSALLLPGPLWADFPPNKEYKGAAGWFELLLLIWSTRDVDVCLYRPRKAPADVKKERSKTRTCTRTLQKTNSHRVDTRLCFWGSVLSAVDMTLQVSVVGNRDRSLLPLSPLARLVSLLTVFDTYPGYLDSELYCRRTIALCM